MLSASVLVAVSFAFLWIDACNLWLSYSPNTMHTRVQRGKPSLFFLDGESTNNNSRVFWGRWQTIHDITRAAPKVQLSICWRSLAKHSIVRTWRTQQMFFKRMRASIWILWRAECSSPRCVFDLATWYVLIGWHLPESHIICVYCFVLCKILRIPHPITRTQTDPSSILILMSVPESCLLIALAERERDSRRLSFGATPSSRRGKKSKNLAITHH